MNSRVERELFAPEDHVCKRNQVCLANIHFKLLMTACTIRHDSKKCVNEGNIFFMRRGVMSMLAAWKESCLHPKVTCAKGIRFVSPTSTSNQS